MSQIVRRRDICLLYEVEQVQKGFCVCGTKQVRKQDGKCGFVEVVVCDVHCESSDGEN